MPVSVSNLGVHVVTVPKFSGIRSETAGPEGDSVVICAANKSDFTYSLNDSNSHYNGVTIHIPSTQKLREDW